MADVEYNSLELSVECEQNAILSLCLPENPEIELDTVHQSSISLDTGSNGKDATINGVNALILNANGTIRLSQIGTIATITSNTFIHEQRVASSIWYIQHNLDKFPSVCVVDSSGSEVICEVEYADSNNVVLIMRSPFKGTAYLN